MTIKVDRQIYGDCVISKAVYWLSGDFSITRHLIHDKLEEITAQSISEGTDSDFETRFMQLLNDFKLWWGER